MPEVIEKFCCGSCERTYEWNESERCPYCNATLQEQFKKRFILHTEVNYKGKKYVVSTVNLIIEHYPNYFYETMVFNKETEEFLEYQERFETKNEAIINHNQIVENFDTFMKEIIIDTL